jgi:hypothetical protein
MNLGPIQALVGISPLTLGEAASTSGKPFSGRLFRPEVAQRFVPQQLLCDVLETLCVDRSPALA